jgi:RNA recognition motif-containing protein
MNIFVSNLNFRVDDNGLQELFASYGEVISAKVIRDKFNNNRSKGFGFVEMADEDAEKAIQELNQTEFDGKVLNVNEARPREERPRSTNNNRNFRSNNGGGYNRNTNNKRW